MKFYKIFFEPITQTKKMSNSNFDFFQIMSLSDNIYYRSVSKDGPIIIDPTTFVTVWCDKNHPTTERANTIYSHLMENGLHYDCPVCKILQATEQEAMIKEKKPGVNSIINEIMHCIVQSMDPVQDGLTFKIYVDFFLFFVLLCVVLFYFAS